MEAKTENKPVRVTLGFKLIVLISLLLVAAVMVLTWASNSIFRADNAALVRQFNANMSAGLAAQTRIAIESVIKSTRGLAYLLAKNPGSSTIQGWFDGNEEVEAIFVLRQESGGGIKFGAGVVSPVARTSLKLDPARLITELARTGASAENEFSLSAVIQGEIQVGLLNVSPGVASIAIAYPISRQSDLGFSGVLCLINPKYIGDLFSHTDGVSSFLVDRHGFMVAHSDRANLAGGEIASKSRIVKDLLEGVLGNREVRYWDSESESVRIGGGRTVGLAGLGVVSEIPEEMVYEASDRLGRLASFLAVGILGVCLFVGSIFSTLIVGRINLLVDASARIANEDFGAILPERGWDEVAHLSRAFNRMCRGLAERKKMRATFAKLHSQGVAERILSGELTLGGERKHAIILFADLRDFTALSTSLNPEQLIQTLNEFMSCMVGVIHSHGGIIDKFVGDAIMAAWGVPHLGEFDAANAVSACLSMRASLAQLNLSRAERRLPELRMGMALNAGVVIAGNIGSEERMEYTIVGEAVNVASRLESATKELGTDLVVAEVVQRCVADQFAFVPAPAAKVRGVSEPIAIFTLSDHPTQVESDALEDLAA